MIIDHLLIVTGRTPDFIVAVDIVQQVVFTARSRKYANRLLAVSRVVAPAFEYLPRGLEKHPLLRVHQHRFPRRKSKEGGFEKLYILQHMACAHIVWKTEIRGTDAGG